MRWSNLFKMYIHAYDPVKTDDGHEIHINFLLLYPLQSLWYDVRRFGLTIAWENFQKVMRQ